jgi:hypothetical protein
MRNLLQTLKTDYAEQKKMRTTRRVECTQAQDDMECAEMIIRTESLAKPYALEKMPEWNGEGLAPMLDWISAQYVQHCSTAQLLNMISEFID